MVISSRKGSEKYTPLKMVKEFVLIELQEYDHLTLSENMNAMFMLSIEQLLNAVKSRVGIIHHNEVDNLFQFLKTLPSILTWSDFGEAIVDGTRLPGSNVHNMLDYLFHDW